MKELTETRESNIMMSFIACMPHQVLLTVKGRYGRDQEYVKILGSEDADWIYWSQQGPEMGPCEHDYEP
jgi:hypothetical protein